MLTEPSERAVRIMFAVSVLAILGLFSLEVALDYEPAKLTALFCFLMWGPLLVIHELGHALMARLFGCTITAVSLGFGRVLYEFRVGHTPVYVRPILVEGFCQFRSGAKPLSRGASALIYFAGPGLELALAAIVMAVVGPDALLSKTDSVPMLAIQSLCLCAVFGAAVNLIPHQANLGIEAQSEGRRPTPNDGLGIVLSLLGRR